jgi:glycosyltransferase involved in cell wall biosynthesis
MISVVMPSYNSAEFIDEAIRSVLAQTYRDFELLVCDDGSSDDTLAIADAFAAQDPRVRVLRNSHGGVSRNCNAGLQAARFPWIARLDADDVALPDRLERQMAAALERPEVVAWGGDARLVNRHGAYLRHVRLGPRNLREYEDLRAGDRVIYILGPTVMFRRDLALELGGYDPRFDSAEDIDLLNRLADRGPVLSLPHTMTLYRVHGSSVTSDKSARQQVLFEFMRERARAGKAGLRIDLDDFLREREERSATARLIGWMGGRARQYYRNTSIHLAEGRYVDAAGSAMLALVCGPTFTMLRFGRRAARSARRRTNAALRRLLHAHSRGKPHGAA